MTEKETIVMKITKAISTMKVDDTIMVVEEETVEMKKTTVTNKASVFTQTGVLLSMVSIALKVAIDIWFDISIF